MLGKQIGESAGSGAVCLGALSEVHDEVVGKPAVTAVQVLGVGGNYAFLGGVESRLHPDVRQPLTDGLDDRHLGRGICLETLVVSALEPTDRLLASTCRFP